MTIRQLPEQLTNKIAAGEVVERPASVVKELIENSIDAKSTHIKVEVEEAGLKSIKVTDNGIGMDEADSKRAFLRHATSKIRYDTDLFRIQSLGFRGEALASIAAVSKVTLKTSTGKEAGTVIQLDGGEIVHEAKADARKGTKITVKQLFYNTPARLKYIKSIHTELGHITDLVNRYALAHPKVRFELLHNGKRIFQTTGSNNVLQVIANIYGHQVAKKMLSFSNESLDFKIDGFVAKPEVTRANRNYISCFVNGRYIRNNGLVHAILRAYDTLLPLHRYPIVVLHIELDPVLVDVNVHPTKLEVRFSKEKELFDLVEETIRTTFQRHVLIPTIERSEKNRVTEAKEQVSFSFSQLASAKEKEQQNDERSKRIGHEHIKDEAQLVDVHERSEQEFVHHDKTDQVFEKSDNGKNKQKNDAGQLAVQKENESRLPTIYPIGQLQGTYILAQNEDGFYMIDQHAAQERIKYEFYKEKLATPKRTMQQLLIPLVLEFTHQEASFIEKNHNVLQSVGIELEPFGTNTYVVRACPDWIPQGLEETFVRDSLEQVIEQKTVDIATLREEMAITMACKRSIKANHYLSEAEIIRLIEDLRKTVDPYTCPHGRPVIIFFSYYEIEKMFKRVM